MTIFDVYITRDADPKPVDYLQTYRFESGNHSYLLHYTSRYQFTEPCEITCDSQDGAKLLPEKGLGKFCVAISSSAGVLAKIHRNKITDSQGKAIAKIQDPTPWLKAIIRTILQGDPEQFHIRATKDKALIAEITEVHRKSRAPWPLSILTALLSLAKSNNDKPRLRIHIHSKTIDPRVILATAAILDAQRGSSH